MKKDTNIEDTTDEIGLSTSLPKSISFQHSSLMGHGFGLVEIDGLHLIQISADEKAFYYVSFDADFVCLHERIISETPMGNDTLDRVVFRMEDDMDVNDDMDGSSSYLILALTANVLNAWCGYVRFEKYNGTMNKNNRRKLTNKQLGSLSIEFSAPFNGSYGVFDTSSNLADYCFPIDKDGCVYECHMKYDKDIMFLDTIHFCIKEDM